MARTRAIKSQAVAAPARTSAGVCREPQSTRRSQPTGPLIQRATRALSCAQTGGPATGENTTRRGNDGNALPRRPVLVVEGGVRLHRVEAGASAREKPREKQRAGETTHPIHRQHVASDINAGGKERIPTTTMTGSEAAVNGTSSSAIRARQRRAHGWSTREVEPRTRPEGGRGYGRTGHSVNIRWRLRGHGRGRWRGRRTGFAEMLPRDVSRLTCTVCAGKDVAGWLSRVR